MKAALEQRDQTSSEAARRISFAVAVAVPVASNCLLQVADVGADSAISLPPWFPSARACAVLQLKVRSFVLISGARGVHRIASLERLAAAPPEQSVTGASVPLGPPVTSSTTLADAVRQMDAAAADHAPVMLGGAVLGIITRAAAGQALACNAAYGWALDGGGPGLHQGEPRAQPSYSTISEAPVGGQATGGQATGPRQICQRSRPQAHSPAP